MSGQWAVVGKRRDSSLATPKTRTSKETMGNGVINCDEILKEIKDHKSQQTDAKQLKIEPKSQARSKSKSKNGQASRPEQFKSIELALNAINVDYFKSIYYNNKVVYPSMPLVWLHELANYLNMHLVVDVQDFSFMNKPHNYPLSTMPNALRAILESARCHAGPDNAARFFDLCLTSMANVMNKNCPALGYKLCIQFLAQLYPKLCLRDVAKCKALLNSYGNQPSIGISILWALGQGGYKDWPVGYKAFQEYMLAMVDMKHYTNFVVHYLASLIQKHESSSCHLCLEEYLSIANFVESMKKHVSREISDVLWEVMPVCNALLDVEQTEKCFKTLLCLYAQFATKTMKKNMIIVIAKCLQRNGNSFQAWNSLYKKHLLASASLLSYIERNWKSLRSDIDVEELKSSLKLFILANANYEMPGTDVLVLDDCIKSIKSDAQLTTYFRKFLQLQ